MLRRLIPVTRLSLRSKLFVAFGGLLAILLLVGGLSLGVLRQYARAVEQQDREQNEAVEASFALSNSLAELNEVLLANLDESSLVLASAAGPSIEMVERNLLSGENSSPASESERRLLQSVTEQWHTYRGEVTRLIALHAQDRRAFLGERIHPALAGLRRAELALRTARLRTAMDMASATRARTERISQAMVLLLCTGVLLGVVYMFFVSRFVLSPINALAESLQEIQKGNLDREIPVRSEDELGSLVGAYNRMAARLREFRRIDSARMTRVQQTTQRAIDSLRDAVALFDSDGAIEVSNSSAQELFDLRPGRTVTDFDFPWLSRLLDQAATTREPVIPRSFESAIQLFRDGREIFFLPNAMPILEADELVGVTIVLADVTLLRRLDEMKTGMVSTVSHELRTPLTSIQMALHLLKSERFGPLTERQTELLRTALGDCGRLMATIEGILDLSRLQSGGSQIDIDRVDPSELISDTTGPLMPAFQEAGIELQIRISPDMPVLLGDARRLGIVLTNLLTNSLKYCPAGTSVSVEVGADDHWVSLVVADTGPGFAREYCGRIFDKFFRLPSAAPQKGAGLGLAICREIVNAHGGTIECTSDVGKGVRFTILLPLHGHSAEVTKNCAGEESPAGAPNL